MPKLLHPVLVVDDDVASAELERRALLRAGHEVHVVGLVAEAVAALRRRAFAVVVLDYHLPDGDAWSVVAAADARTPRVPVVLVTATGDEHVGVEAFQRGISDYVRKADSFSEELPRVIARAMRLAETENQLRLERARLAEAQRIAQIGSWEWDIGPNLVSWSDELFRIFGHDKANFGASYEAFLSAVHPEDRARVDTMIRESIAERKPFRHVYRVLRGGAVGWVEGRGSVTLDQDGNVARMAGTAQDVTEREQQQAKLRESDAFFDMSLDMLSTAGVDGYFRRVSPAFRILGYTEQELTTTPFIDLVHPDDIAATLAEIEKLKLGIKTLRFENRYRCKDGTYRWISWVSSPAPDGTLYGTGRDISEQKRAEQEREVMTEELQKLNSSLRSSLRERDVLLQEIHHRVKNNLQVISSLINLQMRKLDPGENRDTLAECRQRVQAIALIHEKLYQAHDYARVPFADYVRSLVASLWEMGGTDGHVRLELTLEELELPVDQAIPCGLILSELVGNALKHGYPGGRSGTVKVSLQASQQRVLLTVCNDGLGLPAGFTQHGSSSLGLQLVETLARQLQGSLSVERGAETAFKLSFPFDH